MGISYSHLYDLCRREKSHQELQELSVHFYDDVQDFFSEQQAIVSAEGFSSKGEVARGQLLNAKKLFKQLYEAREQKILQLALSRSRTGSGLIDTTKLLTTERELFNRTVSQLGAAREALKIDEQPSLPAIKPAVAMVAQEERVVIKVLKAVPQFLDAAMATYGPYDENQRVELPLPVANVLIRKGTATQE